MFEKINTMTKREITQRLKKNHDTSFDKRYGVFNTIDNISNARVYPTQTQTTCSKESFVETHNDFLDVILSIDKEKIHIVDFGGRIGCHYNMLIHSLQQKRPYNCRNIEYYIVETPDMCERGKKDRVNKPIHFFDNVNKISHRLKIDIFYSHGGLQYSCNIHKDLRYIAYIQPTFILLQNVLIGERCVLTTQIYDNIIIPHWVFNSFIFERHLARNYSLEYVKFNQWMDNGKHKNYVYSIDNTDIKMIPMNILFKRRQKEVRGGSIIA